MRTLPLPEPDARRCIRQFAGDMAERVLRRPPLLYARYRALLAAYAEADAARKQEMMQARLARSLARASRLPAYASRPAAGLSGWPLLDKAEVAGREAAFCNPRLWPWRTAATSGTTGRPLLLRRSLAAIAFEQASIDHMCAGIGLDLASARVAVLRADHIKPLSDHAPPFWRMASRRRMLFSAFHLTPASIRCYADAMRACAPDVLMCYPSALAHLLALLDAAGESLHVPYVLASSETLPVELVAAARRHLGATVIDFYGQAERVAASCGIDGAAHRLLPLYGHVELGSPLGDGYELIGTSLWNDAQILVRYRTGDSVRRVDAADAADDKLGVLPPDAMFYVEGREIERIDLNDGRMIVGLNHLPRGVPGIVSLQVRQVALRVVELLVVPAADYGPASEAAIRANCALKFPADVTLRIIRIDAPVRLASGKASLLLRGYV